TTVGFRHLWGPAKRANLAATAETDPDALYSAIEPSLALGLPFTPVTVSDEWFEWPTLPELFPVSFPGIKTSRDGFLVDVDLDRLRSRVADYFDTSVSHEEIARRYPSVMASTARFDARDVRDTLLRRGGPDESGFIRFAYRPFDTRWLYWEKDTKLLDEKRADYKPHVFAGNSWLSAARHLRKGSGEPQACHTAHMGSLHLIERGALMCPAWLDDQGLESAANESRRPNLSAEASKYLNRVGATVEDLFYHVLAVLHDPGYRGANSGALSLEWPRIPLPGWPDGTGAGAIKALARSASRGRTLAALLDPDTPAQGVTEGQLRPHLAEVAVPATADGRNMDGDDFTVDAGWGHLGVGDAVMPGQGIVIERAFTSGERQTMGEARSALGDSTVDVYLNGRAFWRNIPVAVWQYRLGGYQVLKKWLSYRERDILSRALSMEEILEFSSIARRIGSLLIYLHAFRKG
ncbi:MAG: DNA methyltransferase, partial [Chloroflexi bacterium]|nr:DNA methyltransferase [Chloroflexota bacterium]